MFDKACKVQNLMIPAFQKDEDLLAEIRAYQDKKEGFRIWWLGQSGFLVQWNSIHFLIDPYLSDSLTTKYQDTDKPHVRMSELVIHPEKLTFIEFVLFMKNHFTNFCVNSSIILIFFSRRTEMLLIQKILINTGNKFRFLTYVDKLFQSLSTQFFSTV